MKKNAVLVSMIAVPAFLIWIFPVLVLGKNPEPDASLIFVFFLWAIAVMVMIPLTYIPGRPIWPRVIASVILGIPLVFSLLIAMEKKENQNLGWLLLTTTFVGFGSFLLIKEKNTK